MVSTVKVPFGLHTLLLTDNCLELHFLQILPLFFVLRSHLLLIIGAYVHFFNICPVLGLHEHSV